MSEEPACKIRRVDKFITNTYKLIRNLPEPLNTNQLIGVLLEQFLDWLDQEFLQPLFCKSIHGGFKLHITTYSFCEFLYLMTRYIYNKSKLFSDMSLEEFVNLLYKQCIYLKVNDEDIEHKNLKWLSSSDEKLHVSLRFFETVILTVFLRDLIHGEAYFESFNDEHYIKFLESMCEMFTKENDYIYGTYQYFGRVRMVLDLICEFYDSLRYVHHERSMLLNEIQYVLHTNPDVHPCVKHALHFCL